MLCFQSTGDYSRNSSTLQQNAVNTTAVRFGTPILLIHHPHAFGFVCLLAHASTYVFAWSHALALLSCCLHEMLAFTILTHVS